MNEVPNNPFKSPQSIPEVSQSIPAIKTIPSRARRIAGIVAYFGAGFFGLGGAAAAFLLVYAFLHPESEPGDKGMLAIQLVLAALLGWSGHRLRHRPKGVLEWVIVSFFALMIINVLLAVIIIGLTST